MWLNLRDDLPRVKAEATIFECVMRVQMLTTSTMRPSLPSNAVRSLASSWRKRSVCTFNPAVSGSGSRLRGAGGDGNYDGLKTERDAIRGIVERCRSVGSGKTGLARIDSVFNCSTSEKVLTFRVLA